MQNTRSCKGIIWKSNKPNVEDVKGMDGVYIAQYDQDKKEVNIYRR